MKKLLATLTLIALLAFPVCAQELYQGTAVDETEAPTLNQILGATTSGGFDSLNNTQTWTWNTLTTHNALVLSTTDGTTGNLLSLSETSTGAAGGSALSATLTGSSNTGKAATFANPSATGWDVYATGSAPNYFAGSVGVGNSAPATTLDVNGDITMETGTAGAVLCLTSAHALGHCTSGASCLTTCTCTCAAN